MLGPDANSLLRGLGCGMLFVGLLPVLALVLFVLLSVLF